MSWSEAEARRRFDDLACAVRTSGAQRIDGARDDDLVLITAEEYEVLNGGVVDDDPLREAGPPYFDDMDMPGRNSSPQRTDVEFDE